MTIGEKLKAARGGAGMTQEQAAQRLQVSRQTVSNWENDRSYPDIAGVLALAKLYGLSLDELLREDEGMLSHEGRFVSLGREACFCICALCEHTNNRHLLKAPVPGKQREDLISTTSSPPGCLLWKHLGKAAL